MVAPEFQLVNETSVGGYLNFMQGVLPNGFDTKDVNASYASETGAGARSGRAGDAAEPAADAPTSCRPPRVALITSALATPAVTATSTDAVKLNRVYAAVLMVMASPAYLIQK